MKKFITLMLSASLVLGTLLTSCGSTAGNDETTPSESTSTDSTSGDTSADTDADTSADTTAPENTTVADALRASFLEKADEVVVNDDSVRRTRRMSSTSTLASRPSGMRRAEPFPAASAAIPRSRSMKST